MILKFPDQILDTESVSVLENLSIAEIEKLIARMRSACWNANGFGIAAIQIGEPFRIFGYLSKSKRDLKWIIDPEVISTSGSSIFEEGCLSIPGYYWEILRPEKITLKFKSTSDDNISLDEKEAIKTFKGVESRVIQHELDHMDGLCIPDSMSEKEFDDFRSHFFSGKPVYEYNSPRLDMR